MVENLRRLLLSLCILGIASPLHAQQHQYHAHEGVPAGALKKLGVVHFPISCKSSVQPTFEQGIAMLHSFWYEEARKQFASVAESDPSCAMAQWGLAMTEWRPFWDGMPAERREQGIAELDEAEKLAPRTDRERRYIDSLSLFMHSESPVYAASLHAYTVAMDSLYIAYPDDVEAQAFYGLSLSVDAASDTQDPIAADRRALAVLMPGFAAHPDHPGFAHYIIHTCDNPQLAREALPAAEKYAAIAPASAHALHMPGHIFARLGMWSQDIAVNKASVAASELAAQEHLDGVAHEMHAYEYLLYAYLQDGDDADARKISEGSGALIKHLSHVPGIQNDGMYMFSSYVLVEFPSIFHLERQEWRDVLALPEPEHSLVSTSYFRDWAQAIAAGHLRDTTRVDVAVAHAQSIYKQVEAEGSPISAEIHATFLTMQAWQSYAHGHDADALERLSTAADEQDRVGQAEVDVPAREMFADMLFLQGNPGKALTQYKTALRLSPNRFNGLANGAQAAAISGQTREANDLYRRLLQVTNGGEASQRPELARARAYLKKERSPL